MNLTFDITTTSANLTTDQAVAASSNVVSWQTIFWTLIPLVTSKMAQPSGSVLGQMPRYGIYLRSSPIACGLDSLSIVIQMILIPLYLRTSPRQTIAILLRRRFSESEEEKNLRRNGSIQEVEKLTWFRWLFFILGTLPSAIKLAAMRGVAWSQAWGMMYLSSFLLIEGLSLAKNLDRPNHYLIPWQKVVTPSSKRITNLEIQLRRVDKMLKILTILS